MAEDGSVLIKISGDADELEKNLEKAADSSAKAFEQITDESTKTDKKLTDLGKTAKKVCANDFVDSVEDAAGSLNSVQENASLAESGLLDAAEAGRTLQEALDQAAKKSAASLGKAFTAAAAGIAAASLAAAGAVIHMGDEYNQAVNQVSAATGATGHELESLGETVQMVYKDNFGESLDDVANGISVVRQNTGLLDDELQKATEAGFALRDTFGYDMAESSRAASALMKNFGISAEEAYNIVAVGAQNGADQNGDLLDTLNEYSTQYAALGLSADQFVSGLISGAEAGAFSIDKVGDAVKEFNIRAKDSSDSTIGAFKNLGMNADNMMKRFASGGDTAQKAFFEVVKALEKMKDPVKKNTTAVALFGTQYEDLEKNILPILASMEDGAGKTYDALSQINEVKYNDLGSALGGLKRTIEGALIPAASEIASGPLMDAIETVRGMVDDLAADLKAGKFDDFFEGVAAGITSVVKLLPNIGKTIEKMLPVIEKIGDLVGDVVSIAIDNVDLVIAAIAGVGTAIAALKIISVIGQVIKALKTLGAVLTVSTGGIGLAVLAISSVVAAIAQFIVVSKDSEDAISSNMTATKELCDEYDELHDSIEENRKASEERVSAAEQETAVAEDYAEKLEKLSKKENKSAGEKKRMKYYVDKLNEVLPDLGLEYDAEKDKLNKNTDAIKANIEARKLNAQISAYQTNYDEAVAEEVKLQDAREELDKQNKENLKWQARAQKKYDGISKKRGEAIFDYQQRLREAKKDLDKANEAVAESSGKLEENTRDLEDNAATQKKWGDKLETGLNTQAMNEALSDLQKLAKEGGVTISESVEAGIREGRYQIPDTVKGLKNLIKFDDAVQAAGLSGTQIPKALAEKISNGEISVKDAMNAVEKLAEFDSSEAVKKAEAAGVTIPGVLRQKIASGEMSVQEAIEGLQRRTQFEDAEIVKNARASGLNIPKGLVDSIATGKVSVDEAIQRVKDAMDLSGMATDAGMEGDKAVDSLIKSFLRGEIPVAEASQKLASLVEKNADPNLKATVEPELEKYQQTIQSRGPTVKQTAATALSGSVEAGAQTNLTPTANTAVDSYVDPFYNSGDRVLDATGVMPLNASTGAQTDLNPQGVGGSDTYAAGVRSGGDKAYGAGVFLSNNTQSGANTDLSPTGAQAGGSFANGMQSAMKAVSDICAAIVGQALSKIRSSTKAFQAVGRLLMTQMGTGIRNRATFVTAAAEGVVKRAINYARTEAGRSNSIGRDFSSGIAAGIAANSKEVTDAATSVINRAIAAAKRAADVNSPSKRTRDEVGAPLAEGVAVGIEQGSGDASAAAVDAVEGAVRAANTTAAKSSIDMSGLVTSIPEAKKAIAANMDQLSAQAKAAVQYEMDRRAASISAYNTFSIPAYDDGRVIALLKELVTETRDGKTIMVGQRVLGRTVRQWEQKMARVTGGA